jgi:predicted DNA binding protein
VQRGYFEIPRRVTLTDLAEELGITRQATSERIRRGVNAVLRSVLVGCRDDGSGGDDTAE